MKYLVINLEVIDGERVYNLPCLHQTKAENLCFVVDRYASSFWGELAYRSDDAWYFWGGEIAVTVNSWHEVTKEEYEFLNRVLW